MKVHLVVWLLEGRSAVKLKVGVPLAHERQSLTSNLTHQTFLVQITLEEPGKTIELHQIEDLLLSLSTNSAIH